MTSLMVLEVFASLTVQVTLMIVVVAWAVRRQHLSAAADCSWAALHACILLVTAAAFFLPHLRPVTLAGLCPTASLSTLQIACAFAGRIWRWVWVSGSAAVIVALIGGTGRVLWLVRHATPDAGLLKLLSESTEGIRDPMARVEVRVSSVCVSPFCWQMHHPIIVVPDLLLDFPPAEQVAVMRHELAHLRSKHPLHLFLQRLVEILYWFHPLVWWSSRQAAAAREFRCDREAVTGRQQVADYLRSLLRLIEAQMPTPTRLPAGLGFLGDTSLLHRRADLLVESLDHSVAPANMWRLALAIILALAICFLVWLPINPQASRRATWSPWPNWSAQALEASGLRVRDYEVDGHRLRPLERARHSAQADGP